MSEIDVLTLKQMRAERRPHVVIDVRRPDELEIVRLDGATHIVMDEIPSRLAEIPRDREVVLMCHGGTRSGRVTQFLEQQGFTNVANLKGGIDAWARDVDTTLARY